MYDRASNAFLSFVIVAFLLILTYSFLPSIISYLTDSMPAQVAQQESPHGPPTPSSLPAVEPTIRTSPTGTPPFALAGTPPQRPKPRLLRRFPQLLLLTMTEPPSATLVSTATLVPSGPVVNRNANLRSGPSTTYEIIAGAVAGQARKLNGRNATDNWLRLTSGAWIAKYLVDNSPSDLPVVATPVVPPTRPPP